MSFGVLYYNRGRKMLVRLLVSLHSLRKVYGGQCTVILDKDDTALSADEVAQFKLYADVKRKRFVTPKGKGTSYLNKCLLHEVTPYDTTVFLDADTIVKKSFDELFDMAEQYEFVVTQFADWTSRGIIGGRIKAWHSVYPEMVRPALEWGHAINTGVFAWDKGATFMESWWAHAHAGRHVSRIPDETYCQLAIHAYPHFLAPQEFNCSCKYSNPEAEDVRIIHFHGNKHCRMLNEHHVFNSHIWYREFEEIRSSIPAEWIQEDNQLRKAINA